MASNSTHPISSKPRRSMSGAHKLIAIAAFGALAAAAGCTSGTSTTPASTAASGGSGGTPTVTVASKGTVGAVLSDAQGTTLYRYTPDTPGVSVCTGGCATTWPPLTLPAGVTKPVAGPGVTNLGTIKRADGSLQVTYMGMPLYRYVADTSRTDATGQGLGGTWYVLKASASTPVAPAAPTTTSAPQGSGNAY
jgi:predicted lipoprotein with Yx(FWY)xxD motif